jgi:hypothetical protein
MGTILASNFQCFQSSTWNVDTTSEGGTISANQINADTALTNGGTCTFAASATVTGSGTKFLTDLKVGDMIYNSTDDTVAKALAITAIASDTSLTLSGSYAGTTGASKTAHKIAVNQIIFPSVTDAQRQAGVTQYRKVFIKNANADTVNLKFWIQVAYSGSETISVAAGTSNDVQSAATGYTYYSPTSIADAHVIDLGSLAQNASASVWIKRVVAAGVNGYVNDTFQIEVGMY